MKANDIRMKDIVGYEGLYAITSCGKVWSYKRQKFLRYNYVNGYAQVTLFKDGKRNNKIVSRLVAEAYLPNPDKLPEVDHQDQDRTHNYLNNLAWKTRIGNACNRSDSIQVYCTTTGMIYCSICMASRALKCSEHKIKNHCERYAKDKSVLPQFIYLSDLTPDIVRRYYPILPNMAKAG